MAQVKVGNFEIPDTIAHELSDLLIKQTIREKMLYQAIENKNTGMYDELEKMLIPVTERIEALKIKITNEYVPSEFNDEKFVWNYDGYEVAKNVVNIYENK